MTYDFIRLSAALAIFASFLALMSLPFINYLSAL